MCDFSARAPEIRGIKVGDGTSETSSPVSQAVSQAGSQSVSLSLCQAVSQSVCLFVSLSVCLSVSLSVCLSVSQSVVSQSVSQSVSDSEVTNMTALGPTRWPGEQPVPHWCQGTRLKVHRTRYSTSL